MDYFKKIILNVPHSSISNYYDGWTNKLHFFNVVKRYTDWHTDLVYSSTTPNVIMHQFPYSKFYVDVDKRPDDETEMFGEGILYTDFLTFNRQLDDATKHHLTGIYHQYMDELSADLDYGSLLITCKAFNPAYDKKYDVLIGFNENDGSQPSSDTLKEIACIFKDNGYRVEFKRSLPVITPKFPIFYRAMRISINKLTYLDDLSLSLNKKFIKIHDCLNMCYKYLLGTDLRAYNRA